MDKHISNEHKTFIYSINFQTVHQGFFHLGVGRVGLGIFGDFTLMVLQYLLLLQIRLDPFSQSQMQYPLLFFGRLEELLLSDLLYCPHFQLLNEDILLRLFLPSLFHEAELFEAHQMR